MTARDDRYRELRRQGYSVAQSRRMADQLKTKQWEHERAAERLVEQAAAAGREALVEQVDFTHYKQPTNTEYPGNGWRNPRSRSASYDTATQVLNIVWWRPGKGGKSTNYYNVSRQEWEQLCNINIEPSTGKYVNRVLNGHPYDTF